MAVRLALTVARVGGPMGAPRHVWPFGAVAVQPVEAFEFDSRAVLARCDADPQLGYELTRFLAVMAGRLQATRMRLLDRYTPYSALA